MAPERVKRKLAAILAADVADYLGLMARMRKGAALVAHRCELIDRKIAEHRARIVKTTGNGVLVDFGSLVDARQMEVRWDAFDPQRR